VAFQCCVGVLHGLVQLCCDCGCELPQHFLVDGSMIMLARLEAYGSARSSMLAAVWRVTLPASVHSCDEPTVSHLHCWLRR